MGSYKKNRSFTDKIHSKLALRDIYSKLGWQVLEPENEELAFMRDCHRAIDYVAKGINGKTIHIQERFRKYDSKNQDCITLRYMWDGKEDIERYSEFFKMKAEISRHKDIPFYLVYGVVNEDETAFIKYVVINMKDFFDFYKGGCIAIDEGQVKNENAVYGKIHSNGEKDSSFVSFNVKELRELCVSLIHYQEGYYNMGSDDKVTESQLKGLHRRLAEGTNFQLKLESELTKKEADVLIKFLDGLGLDSDRSGKVKESKLMYVLKESSNLEIIKKYLVY